MDLNKNRYAISGESGRGVAVYFIRSMIAIIIGGIVWFAGNVILFDSETGIVPITDNMSDATETYFGDIAGHVHWFWSIFPFVLMLGAAIYVIYGALSEEPYRR